MTEYGIDRGPSRTGIMLATVAMLGSLAALTFSGVPSGLGIGALGAIALLGGTYTGSRKVLDVAAVVLFVGILFAGIGGGRALHLLVSLVGLVIAWDVSEHAISVGEQLGREAPTRRLELVHAAESSLVGAGGAAVGYGVFRVAGGNQPASSLVILLLGGVLITWALRR